MCTRPYVYGCAHAQLSISSDCFVCTCLYFCPQGADGNPWPTTPPPDPRARRRRRRRTPLRRESGIILGLAPMLLKAQRQVHQHRRRGLAVGCAHHAAEPFPADCSGRHAAHLQADQQLFPRRRRQASPEVVRRPLLSKRCPSTLSIPWSRLLRFVSECQFLSHHQTPA